MRARGYKPFGTNSEQDVLLDQIITFSTPVSQGLLGVFDLDGCLFDHLRCLARYHLSWICFR